MERRGDSMVIGSVYGRLTVTADAGRSNGQDHWSCRCECGAVKIVRGATLRRGTTRSCGCLRDELAKQAVTHGHTRRGQWNPLYRVWNQMIQRCHNPKNMSYARYGGRGIAVCERWRTSYENFLADMGERPPGMTIDRRENSKGYEPGNCKWSTATEQALNRRPRAPTATLQQALAMDAMMAVVGWVAFGDLLAISGVTRRVMDSLVTNGWAERSGSRTSWHYRITSSGRESRQGTVRAPAY